MYVQKFLAATGQPTCQRNPTSFLGTDAKKRKKKKINEEKPPEFILQSQRIRNK